MLPYSATTFAIHNKKCYEAPIDDFEKMQFDSSATLLKCRERTQNLDGPVGKWT
jgi:hypothetical protein